MNRLFLCDNIQNIYNAYSEEQIGKAPVMTGKELIAKGGMPEIEEVFSSWGMPCLTEDQIEKYLPNLKAVYYGAGTVQAFARPFLKKGIRVFSAWAANAVPVAEFTLAQILLANKGFFQLDRRYRNKGFEAAVSYAEKFDGNYHTTVGLLGAGMVGRKVIELLKPFEIDVKVFDPFLPDEKAVEMGVEKLSLWEIFETCPIVSNHLANNADTVGMLDYSMFSRMGKYGVFINTGRNAQVVEEDLVRAMKEEPTRTAILDVTDPDEPLPEGHLYWTLPNIIVTPHRAGSVRKEIYRMGTYMMEERDRVENGEQPLYEVTESMLKTMA